MEATTAVPEEVRTHTLKETTGMVRRHADLLDGVAQAFRDRDYKHDPDLLEIALVRAEPAARDLWAVENEQQDDSLGAVWPGNAYEALWTLPLVIMSTRLALNAPNEPLPVGGATSWCVSGLERVVAHLQAWLAEAAS